MPTADIEFRDPEVLSSIGPTTAVRMGFDPAFGSATGPGPQLQHYLHCALVDTANACRAPGTRLPEGCELLVILYLQGMYWLFLVSSCR